MPADGCDGRTAATYLPDDVHPQRPHPAFVVWRSEQIVRLALSAAIVALSSGCLVKRGETSRVKEGDADFAKLAWIEKASRTVVWILST